MPERRLGGAPAVKARSCRRSSRVTGPCSALARNSIQISYCTRSAQLARDVQQLLLEFGVVSRLCQHATGEWKVVHRQPPRRAALRRKRRLLGPQAGQAAQQSSRGIPQRARALSSDHVPYVASTCARCGSRTDRDWLAGTTSTGSSAGSATATRSGSRARRGGRRGRRAAGRRPLLLRRGRRRSSDAGVQPVFSVRVDSDDHTSSERLRQPQHGVPDGAAGDGDAAGHRPGHRRFPGQLRRQDPGARRPAQPLPEPARQRLRRHRGRHGHEHPAAQPARGRRRACSGRWEPRGERRGAARPLLAAHQGPGLPDRRAHRGHPRHRGGLPHRPRADHDARRRHVEEIQGRTCLVVTELPYQVNPDNLTVKISELVDSGRIQGIADLRDDTSDKTGLRIVVVLKRDAVAKVVLNNLYKHTQLQDTFGANMLALVDGVPRTLSLDKFVRHWVDHQIEVVVRRTRYLLAEAERSGPLCTAASSRRSTRSTRSSR